MSKFPARKFQCNNSRLWGKLIVVDFSKDPEGRPVDTNSGRGFGALAAAVRAECRYVLANIRANDGKLYGVSYDLEIVRAATETEGKHDSSAYRTKVFDWARNDSALRSVLTDLQYVETINKAKKARSDADCGPESLFEYLFGAGDKEPAGQVAGGSKDKELADVPVSADHMEVCEMLKAILSTREKQDLTDKVRDASEGAAGIAVHPLDQPAIVCHTKAGEAIFSGPFPDRWAASSFAASLGTLDPVLLLTFDRLDALAEALETSHMNDSLERLKQFREITGI